MHDTSQKNGPGTNARFSSSGGRFMLCYYFCAEIFVLINRLEKYVFFLELICAFFVVVLDML
jgi:hypothetical protein